ncbi:50S ribosomal protein L11 methyltransferase [Parabacteroides sp. An277]|uniref:50S ribosomal protein L11 methyltransferase n=1 Tax=Parabacteroides sp. An277 TaxID=1965619 RepID=UPI000B39BA55|nr:50S ribosomal protein L11 methyltransferase [Parabacteroides sp. An277]OUO50740.1 50S ribosomal protein L11 methyltransferase [Parabacteroides sp. An277]
MNYYEVTFTYDNISVETETISDVLASELGEIGFESFKENADGLQAYIPENNYREATLQEKLKQFPIEGIRFHYTIQRIEDQDWNEEWEKNYFKPIRIGKECIIRASFHEPEKGYTYNIIIDPKMAFGTGNHATTFLMIQEMLQLDLTGKELLDMGCGTAVLAILAKMRNAQRVVAIDIDEWAYHNAIENIHINHTDDIEVALGGAERIAEFGKFDVVFANINRNILLADMHYYAANMKKDAYLFMSGFYTEDIPVLTEECRKNGLEFQSYTEKEHWAAIKTKKC